MTSLAGSLPKVTPRDVLTGGGLTGTGWVPMGSDGMTRKKARGCGRRMGLDFFWGCCRWEVVIGGAYMFTYIYIYM